jgi:UDP-N-acetylmuramoylalanine--D-glutamate ligase
MFENKKVLIFGLGILGGGLSSVEFFIKNKSFLRITDLRDYQDLKKVIKKIDKIAQKFNYPYKITYILGKHRQEDFDWAEIIVVNPAISYKNQLLKYAQNKKKIIVNDCYLFFSQSKGDFIAFTGTRGKTTTTLWTYELFKKFLTQKVLLGGNQPNKSLLKILEKTNNNSISILEISCFQLEFMTKKLKAPKIAGITNIYEDHLNRYQSLTEYATIKSKIFLNQKKNDYLILNYDNLWKNFFLQLKPKSQVYFISFHKLPKKINGLFIDKNYFVIKNQKVSLKISIKKVKDKLGKHNLYNLMMATLSLYLYCQDKNLNFDYQKIEKFLPFLKTPNFRQEIIYQNKNLTVVNDSASTAPQATIEALERFAKKFNNIILIVGGTDKNLNFQKLALYLKQKIKPKNLLIVQGSGSLKLINELEKIKYQVKKENLFDDLKKAIKNSFQLFKKNKKNIIIFSPGAASFEKFKNEFDRGQKFNRFIKSYLNQIK